TLLLIACDRGAHDVEDPRRLPGALHLNVEAADTVADPASRRHGEMFLDHGVRVHSRVGGERAEAAKRLRQKVELLTIRQLESAQLTLALGVSIGAKGVPVVRWIVGVACLFLSDGRTALEHVLQIENITRQAERAGG